MSCQKQQREDIKIVDQIQAKVERQLTADGTLYVEAQMTGMFKEVKKLGFRLRSTKKLNLEEARILYVDCVATLLKEVNENEKIRPYLIKYPFTYENTDVLLSFDDGNISLPPYIALMYQAKGKVYYRHYKKETASYEGCHTETFEGAVKIVEETTGKKIDLGY